MKPFLALIRPGVGLLLGAFGCPLSFCLNLWAISAFDGPKGLLYDAINGPDPVAGKAAAMFVWFVVAAVCGATLGAVAGQSHFLWQNQQVDLARKLCFAVGLGSVTLFGFWSILAFRTHSGVETHHFVPFDPLQIAACLPLLAFALVLLIAPFTTMRRPEIAELLPSS